MKFKDIRYQTEFQSLIKLNVQLYQLVCEVEQFSMVSFNIEPVITSIYRSELEQEKIYGYRKSSVHCEWRGVDLRSSVYTAEQVQAILAFINSSYLYDQARPDMKCAIYHTVGAGFHLHLQNHPKTIKKKSLSNSMASVILQFLKLKKTS